MQKPSQDEQRKTQEAMEAAVVLEKSLDLHALGSTLISDFLEGHCPDEEMKHIKKTGNHLTHLYKLAIPGWVGQASLQKAHPQTYL